MKIRVVLSLLLTGLLSTTAFAGIEQPGGEKLIAFEPDPGIWEVHNKDVIESKSLVWFKKDMRAKGRVYDDFYMVNIYNQSENGLDHMRNRYDFPGRRSCDSFESIDMESAVTTPYSMMLWSTTCLKTRDPEARIIHLIVMGERHIYHVQKGWRGKVDPTDVAIWTERMKNIFVCDLSREDAACPAGAIPAPQTEQEAAQDDAEEELNTAAASVSDKE